MKKYRICFYLFMITSLLCFGIGLAATRAMENRKDSFVREYIEETIKETEQLEDAQAANRQQIAHQAELEEAYYLVEENGFLLVFSKDKQSVCLYTHIPLMELPQEEQSRLREGIWFSSMTELFQYLESCTS